MSDKLDASGKTVVVTGAASGIGRCLARQLSDEGARLILADIDKAGLDAVAREIEAKGVDVIARQVDMADFAAVDAFAAEALDWANGSLVFVFANAGIHGITPAIDPDLDLFAKVTAVNLMGPVHMSKAFVPRLMKQGIPAQLVITGSQASFLAAPGIAPYVAAKHALWGFADSLRIELLMEQSPVGVSLVAPSRVDTAITRQRVGEYHAKGGDKAVEAYITSMVGPEPIAEVIIREAKKREFWIIPSHEPTLEVFKARADAVIHAMPAGEIKHG
ncbi:MAG: SDR family NAD(P)-dependent oxidoreductase [Novosphingobium sp.]|nr:SDR family NAD(P)-dependent oxidoreductase [Novosphingobium sp.]